MIFSHSWNEKRLRKQIARQITRRQHPSKFKRLVLIALGLFVLFILYTNLTIAKDKGLMPTYKSTVSLDSH